VGQRALGQALADALLLVGLYAEKDPARFEWAAIRWHGRLELEAKDLGFADSQLALAALSALRGDRRAEAAQLLAVLVKGRLAR
jgi:hypothetical protein